MSIKHSPTRVKEAFIDETEITAILDRMEADGGLLTEKGYTNEPFTEPRLVSFTKKHLIYLKAHPKVNPQHYLANLRTMIKVRR